MLLVGHNKLSCTSSSSCYVSHKNVHVIILITSCASSSSHYCTERPQLLQAAYWSG